MLGGNGLRCAAVLGLLLGTGANAFAADDGVWSVSKSSGEVWVSTSGAEQVALKQDGSLKPGDSIRTGHNGRVLLVRGEETILISPNSVIGLPTEKKDGLSTTIMQQAGSILLEVEKRNVKHFEVETPYLAAVVKGTQFSVSVNAASTSVEVRRGQVEVSDFKTGQIAQVLPGQAATVFSRGKPGLTLSGSGSFNPIEQGKPRASGIERIPVPKSGLSAPREASNGRLVVALADKGGALKSDAANSRQAGSGTPSRAGVVRISNSLGEVNLNFAKVTHGLAHASVVPGAVRNATTRDTVWGGETKATASTVGANSIGQDASNNGNAATGAAGVGTAIATAASVVAAADSANSKGNGASGGGNSGNGFGSSAAGGGNGAAGNNGNGNGSGNGSGSGNGLALGRGR